MQSPGLLSPSFQALLCALASSLALGAGAQPVQGGGETWPYTVKRGDTLIGIAQELLRSGGAWRELQRLNKVAHPRRLMPGRVLHIPLSWLREQPLQAEVLHAHGSVTLERGGAAPRPLVGGQQLDAGDIVSTGAQSSASLRFADGSRVMIRPQSRLRLDRSVRLGRSDAVQTQLHLDAGGADSRVPAAAASTAARTRPQPLQIRNAVVNLGVRGTEFRAHLQGDTLRLEVLAGQVVATPAAAGGAGLDVDVGQGTLGSSRAVDAPRPLLAAPQLGELPVLVQRLPLSFVWPAQAGVNGYRAQVFAADDRLVLDGLFTHAGARWSGDIPDGNYELRVRAADADGIEGLDTLARFRLKARPEPPLSTAPTAGAKTADESLRFAWTRNPDAARYRLQLSERADFMAPLVDRDDLTATQLQLALPLGTLHWRLASIRADGDMGPWGDAATVTRVAVPPAPAPEPPQAGAGGITLRWASRGQSSYRIQIARDAAFAQVLHDERTGDTQWLLRSPAPGSYYVRTQAIDADGFAGPFGQPQLVDVPTTGSSWWWLLIPVLLLLI